VVGRVANALVGTVIVALIGLISAQLFVRAMFAALLLGALTAAIQHRRSAHRYRWALVAGALAGLMILTRANAATLLAPLTVAVWDARPRWS
jgi:4-amino-4-deoxy-L-arabinose transferase-like glycosyltransferase